MANQTGLAYLAELDRSIGEEEVDEIGDYLLSFWTMESLMLRN